MLDPRQENVPHDGHHVDVEDAEGGRNQEEVDVLRRRPDAPIKLHG